MENETQTLPAVQEEMSVMPEVLQTAPDILLLITKTRNKAKETFDGIVARIETDGMSDLYDKELSDYIDRVGTAIKNSNEKRRPVTQIIDRIKKSFTETESDMKGFKDSAQKLRNDYATAKMNKLKAEEALRKAEEAKTTEAADLKAAIKTAYEGKFADIIFEEKTKFNDWFNALKYSDILPDSETLFHYASTYLTDWKTYYITQPDVLEKWKAKLPAVQYHTVDEVKNLASDFKMKNLSKLEKEMETEVSLLIIELTDKLPSKVQELEDLANADAKEAERILGDAAIRQAEEAAALQAQAESRKEQSKADANVTAAGEKAGAMVDATAKVEEAPKVAESYNIVIENSSAWPVLFMFWFENEGKSLATDKLEKVTMLRIKAFCEKWAKDKGEMVKSDVISYEAVYKAK